MGLLPSVLAGLRAVCATFPDPRKGRSGNIAMADFGVAAFALFFMQSASFLSFQRTLEKGQGRSTPQDGAEKQDCERNAVKRWHDRHGERLRPLRPVYLGDDLFACQPIVAMLAAAGDDFIFTCKESSHKALYDFIDGAEPERHQEKIRKGKTVETRRYRWIEGVPVRDGKDAALVNWIGFEIFDRNSRVKYSIAWVTSLPVNKTNVAEIAACGRARCLQRDEKSRLCRASLARALFR
jgi:hypothetical protein